MTDVQPPATAPVPDSVPVPDPDPLRIAERWRRDGRGVAVATVISTWGSSPRPVGSQLVLDSDGDFVGSVSGGCIEGAVIEQGIEAIRDGNPRVLDFGVSDEQAWEVGLTCRRQGAGLRRADRVADPRSVVPLVPAGASREDRR